MSQVEETLRARYPNGHPKFIDKCIQEMDLHSRKNADYAHDGDPLGNFKRVSQMWAAWGVDKPAHVVAFEYLMKQLDAVGNMIGNNYEGTVEGIVSKLRDISVYAKLTEILYEESLEKKYGITQ